MASNLWISGISRFLAMIMVTMVSERSRKWMLLKMARDLDRRSLKGAF